MLLKRLYARIPRASGLLVPALVVAVAAGLVLFFPRQGGDGEQRVFSASMPPAADPAPIKVYIAGAVHNPGVYTLKEGDRVEDLLRLAGGPTEDAQMAAVNLAAHLRDAQQVTVPRADQTEDASAPADGLININTASKSLLESLPDIGEVRAQRIIDSRTKDGPFAHPQDLVTRKIITERIFTKLRDRITVQ